MRREELENSVHVLSSLEAMELHEFLLVVSCSTTLGETRKVGLKYRLLES